jgi:hypothetical protein
MSDHTGTNLLYLSLPPKRSLIAYKGHESDDFREALAAGNIKAWIPPKRNRKAQYIFLKQTSNTRYKVEKMSGKL